jgi:hypothetical protein
MRNANPAKKSASYQQNDCRDRVGATCNRVTVLAGHRPPYRDQEIPLLLFSCLLKLLYKSKWLLKEEAPQIASAGWDLGCDGSCYPPLQPERRC